MPRFSANLSMLFTEQASLLDRFDAAAKAGFHGVEYIGAYDFPEKEVAARLKKHGLAQVLFNLPLGDWAKGERGIAVLPDRVELLGTLRTLSPEARARGRAAFERICTYVAAAHDWGERLARDQLGQDVVALGTPGRAHAQRPERRLVGGERLAAAFEKCRGSCG